MSSLVRTMDPGAFWEKTNVRFHCVLYTSVVDSLNLPRGNNKRSCLERDLAKFRWRAGELFYTVLDL